MTPTETLITISHLTMALPSSGGLKHILHDLSFTIYKGETLGLVGESGSGKSTLARALLRLLPAKGKVIFESTSLFDLSPKQMQRLRRKMQIIFQDPYACLNPRMTAYEILSEPLDIHSLWQGPSLRRQRILQLLDIVGLPQALLYRHPYEFSGGQRQRLGIARALAVEPTFLICDEVVAALDVSIQAQIIGLLQELQKEFKLTYLFISHDLPLVKYLSHRVAVMLKGHLVEMAPTHDLYAHPLHPYTRALLAAIPSADPSLEKQRQRDNSMRAPEAEAFRPALQESVTAPSWQEVSPQRFLLCHAKVPQGQQRNLPFYP